MIISVDHKPILGFLNDRDLGSIKNMRLRKLKENTMSWQYIQYNPGKLHDAADAASRYQTHAPISEVFSIFIHSKDKTWISQQMKSQQIS